jgi:putative membrane protein
MFNGIHSMGSGGWVLMAVFWVALLALMVWPLMRLLPTRTDERRDATDASHTPREILDRRLADGEIDAETTSSCAGRSRTLGRSREGGADDANEEARRRRHRRRGARVVWRCGRLRGHRRQQLMELASSDSAGRGATFTLRLPSDIAAGPPSVKATGAGRPSVRDG